MEVHIRILGQGYQRDILALHTPCPSAEYHNEKSHDD